MKTTNYTDLRKNLKKYLDLVINDSDTIIINRDSDSGVVIISLEEYNSFKETEYIMSSAETMKHIKAAERNIAEGDGKRIKDSEELSEFANSL